MRRAAAPSVAVYSRWQAAIDRTACQLHQCACHKPFLFFFLYLLYKHTSHTDKQANSVLLLSSCRLLAFSNSLAVAFSAVVILAAPEAVIFTFPFIWRGGKRHKPFQVHFIVTQAFHALVLEVSFCFSASRFSANERLIFIFMNVDLKEASSSKRCKNRIWSKAVFCLSLLPGFLLHACLFWFPRVIAVLA